MRKPCRASMCPNVAVEGTPYCIDHQNRVKPRQYKESRQDRAKRGYDYEWYQLAKQFLLDNPYCEMCIALGVTPLPSKYAHHKIPIEDAPELRLDLSNLASLCPTCHQIAHKRINQAKALGLWRVS